MRRGLDDGNGGWGELAGFANQYQGHIDPRGQRRRIDKAAGLATHHRIDFGPVTGEVGLQQRRAQGQPTRLLGDVEHVAELDARAWEVGYRTHHISPSLQVLVYERKQVMFGKPFCRLVAGRVIVEDETGAVVQGRQIRPAIVAVVVVLVVVTIVVTAVAPSANPPRLFTSLDAYLEQPAVWHQMRQGCDRRLVSHSGD